MKGHITVIDNNLRVYQVIDSNGRQFFCNIQDLNRIVAENNMHPGYFKIYHFWDNRAELVSARDLQKFFKSSQLAQNFHYSSR